MESFLPVDVGAMLAVELKMPVNKNTRSFDLPLYYLKHCIKKCSPKFSFALSLYKFKKAKLPKINSTERFHSDENRWL